ncbi:GlcG/HbpS family heme-binding protein [Agromyces silvae]|uniref:GlcG/HbpS family heme-binding protein n=1 Tax=Agromyces silvae TaxID=3388266 RepID=UPI00280A59EB|nr:heme-binding protein [Agromyces protaetiae]
MSVTRPVVGVEAALAAVYGGLNDARAAHGETSGVAVAVVGPAGELVAFGAHDLVGPLPRRVALRKAYTAVLLRRSTREAAASVADGRLDLEQLGDDELLVVPGGEPVRSGGAVLGAVGVSGLSADDDEAIAVELVQRLV